ncbi:MAG: hypothetical protein J0L73_17730 [Verrucomicrobia bacterium]|jgi:hypothetical protein|nr:hypothetical protein [Verrucomicrobiota bacterium]
MSAPTDDIPQQIKRELTQALWNKLLLYADISIRQHIWHGVLGGLPLHGKSADDYLQDALMKTWTGKRKWKPTNCSLEQHLRGVLDSDINHDSMRPMNQRILREGSSDCDDSQDSTSFFDRIAAETITIEEVEKLKEWDTMIFEFLEELSDDKPVQQLFEAIFDGTIKRADQAKALGVLETQIDAFKKRLSTRVKNFITNQIQKPKEVHHA